MGFVRGLTIALNAGENRAVLDFYAQIFQRGPDTAPLDNFLEWQVARGTWLQISTGHDRPGGNTARVRFETNDIHGAVARMQQYGVPIGDIVVVPDMVSFANFSDHWGNALGFYQLLSARPLLSEEERAAFDHPDSDVDDPTAELPLAEGATEGVAEATNDAIASAQRDAEHRGSEHRDEGKRGRRTLFGRGRQRGPSASVETSAVREASQPPAAEVHDDQGLLDEVMAVGSPESPRGRRSRSEPSVPRDESTRPARRVVHGTIVGSDHDA